MLIIIDAVKIIINHTLTPILRSGLHSQVKVRFILVLAISVDFRFWKVELTTAFDQYLFVQFDVRNCLGFWLVCGKP